MVGDGFGNQSVQARMQHLRGGLVSSGSAVASAFAPTPTWSFGGSLGADADCGLHQRHLEDGGLCAGYMVRGWEVWFPPSTC